MLREPAVWLRYPGAYSLQASLVLRWLLVDSAACSCVQTLSRCLPAAQASCPPSPAKAQKMASREARSLNMQWTKMAAPSSPSARSQRTLPTSGKVDAAATQSLSQASRSDIVPAAAAPRAQPIADNTSFMPKPSQLHLPCMVVLSCHCLQDMSQARFTLTGTARELSGAEQEAAKQTFLKRNPDSFWVNFGDFSWWRLEELVSVRFVLGFAQAGQVGLACLSSAVVDQLIRIRSPFRIEFSLGHMQVTKEDYAQAQADPVMQFAAPIAGHMNEDHGSQLQALVQHAVPLGGPISKAVMLGLDRFGMEVQCTDSQGQTFPCRVPFPRCHRRFKSTVHRLAVQFCRHLNLMGCCRPATDRKSVRELVVEMTRAAEAAQ